MIQTQSVNLNGVQLHCAEAPGRMTLRGRFNCGMG